ncbi:hypothetical protein OVA24_09065 [Luteolibacter sp. SL250]|uniref:hypothetical protein n=1 Tax=Luteolibacter sp. SL250 TaxID=2995170 RepID=UPI00227152AB|nr:hypothetical protein [Luteolibacter sp. SL250]WAC21532.1 hypothetical protein OVA24_09065 [Luteolibacter sp. SL250]
MKRAWWLLAALVVLLTAIVAVSSAWKSRNYSKSKANVAVLAGLPGIEPVEQREFNGTRVRTTSMENRLRGLAGMDLHEVPFQMVEHQFRNAAGRFSVQVWETNGKVDEVAIYGDPSSGLPPATMATLKRLFPDADYHPKP